MINHLITTFSYDPITGIITRNKDNTPITSTDRYGYIKVTTYFEGKRYYMLGHRVAWLLHYGEWPSDDIDHINQSKVDNAIGNLRVVSHSDNMKNRGMQSNNTSGYTGIHWNKKTNKWVARIGSGKAKTRITIGSFDTVEEAIAAREEAKITLGYHPNHS